MGNSPSFEKRGQGRFSGIAGKEEIWIIKYDYKLLESLRSVIASYLGHMKWADTYSLKIAILKRYDFLKEYFSFESSLPPLIPLFPLIKGGQRGLLRGNRGLLPLYKYCEIFPSVKSQYLYYACMFRGMAVFFQVGSFYEFYGKICDAIGALKNIPSNKRGALYGFPMKLKEQYMRKVLSKGLPVVLVHETGMNYGRIKERLPMMKILPRSGSAIEGG